LVFLLDKCSLVKKIVSVKNSIYFFSLILFFSCSKDSVLEEDILPKSTHYQYSINPILSDQSGKLFFVTKNTVNGNEVESELVKSDLLLLKLNENGEKVFEEKFEYSSQVFTDKAENIYVVNFINDKRKTEILILMPLLRR
jgi:hypothetical protein